jgi:hypothetical protein
MMKTLKFIIGSVVAVSFFATSVSLLAGTPDEVVPSAPAPAGLVDDMYVSAPIPFNLRDISGSGTAIALSDDQRGGPYPIGFTVSFYGSDYTEAYISSNGFVSFEAGSSGCCTGQPLPTADGVDNLVAGFWEDLDPPEGGTLRYQTLGAAPNREFVVGFYNIQHWPGGTPVTFEMIIHEGSNEVELQYGSAPTDGGTHSTGVESASGVYGTQVDYGPAYSYSNEGFLLTPGGVDPEPLARFEVQKLYDDGNPAPVDVTITCNTGLPLQQSTTIGTGPAEIVTFVVTDFADGDLNCSISEDPVPEGYVAWYFPEYEPGDPEDTSCDFEGVVWGGYHQCGIANLLQSVEVEVTKWWLDDNPEFNAINFASANYSCVNEWGDTYGSLDFLGDGDVESFYVYPHYNGTTTCTVVETVVEGGVEFDDSECYQMSVVFMKASRL